MSTQHTGVEYARNTFNNKIQDNAGSTSFDHSVGLRRSGLAVFRREVEQSIRGVRTLWRDEKSAWVYMDGEYMTMGWIGYGDFQTSKNGASKYVVYSRTIRNMKYSDHNAQYHMRMAKGRDIALKAAKAQFRNYSPTETAEALRSKVSKPVNIMTSEARTKTRDALAIVGLESYGTAMKRTIQVFEGLITSGHVFPQADFHNDLLSMFAAKKEADRLDTPKLPMTFVRVYEKFGKQRVDACLLEDVKSSYNTNTTHLATWNAEDTPEDIQGKVAVMSMCEDNQFVEGVGFKVNAATFFFYVEEVTT
jgi:hypothetical protein